MSEYTKIPILHLARTVSGPVAKLLGTVTNTGHKALDAVELMLADTQTKAAHIKSTIRTMQASAIQEAAKLERRAILSTNAILSDKASTLYEEFLKKLTAGGITQLGGIVAEQAIQYGDSTGVPLVDRDVAGRVAAGEANLTARVNIDIRGEVVEELRENLHQQARDLIDRTNTKVSELIAERLQLSEKAIQFTDKTLGSIEKAIEGILKYVTTFEKFIDAILAPLAALRAAILVIKAIPLPQRYLIVCFTIIQSDLLEMMEQLISQAEEEVRAIRGILSMIETALAPLLERIKRIRAMIAAMKADNLFLQASESDVNILDQAGIYDKETGDSIFDAIQGGSGGYGGGSSGNGGTGWYPYGNIGDVDLTDPRIGNQIQVLNPGDYIHFGGYASGSYVEDYYKWSIEQPPYPKGRPEDEGWSRYPDRPNDRLQDVREKLWRLSLLETGKGIVFGGYDKAIVDVPAKEWEDLFKTIDQFKSIQAGVGVKSDKEGEVINYDPLTGYRYGSNILLLGENNFEQKPGILKPSSWEALEISALDRLRDLPLSDTLKDYLQGLWQKSAAEEAGTSNLIMDAVAYRAANGELYYLRVVEDEHSPKVAVRRYVQVKDESGTVILDGIKTFSLDKDALIEEMKLQLDQLVR